MEPQHIHVSGFINPCLSNVINKIFASFSDVVARYITSAFIFPTFPTFRGIDGVLSGTCQSFLPPKRQKVARRALCHPSSMLVQVLALSSATFFHATSMASFLAPSSRALGNAS